MKKRKLQVLGAVLLGMIIGLVTAGARAQTNASAATASPTAEDAKQIDELRHGVVEAFNHRDVDGMMRYLDSNVVVVWQNGEVNQGPEAVKQFYNRMMVQGVVKSVSFDPVVQGRACQGNTCVSVGTLQDTFTLNDGKVLPFNSRWTATVIKSEGGAWKIAAFHASANAFDNPVIKIAERKMGMIAGGGGLLLGLIIGAVLFRRKG
jgi:ketosteroid isomerase-like protein